MSSAAAKRPLTAEEQLVLEQDPLWLAALAAPHIPDETPEQRALVERELTGPHYSHEEILADLAERCRRGE